MIAIFILVAVFFYIFIFPILAVKDGVDSIKVLQKPESERTWKETKDAKDSVEFLIILVLGLLFGLIFGL